MASRRGVSDTGTENRGPTSSSVTPAHTAYDTVERMHTVRNNHTPLSPVHGAPCTASFLPTVFTARASVTLLLSAPKHSGVSFSMRGLSQKTCALY